MARNTTRSRAWRTRSSPLRKERSQSWRSTPGRCTMRDREITEALDAPPSRPLAPDLHKPSTLTPPAPPARLRTRGLDPRLATRPVRRLRQAAVAARSRSLSRGRSCRALCAVLIASVALGLLLTSPVRAEPPQIAAKRRSEEHTSELQSRGHLVCRLLL